MDIWQCKHCAKENAFQSTRMAKHLREECVTAPESLKELLRNLETENSSGKKRKMCEENIESQDDTSKEPKVVKTSSNMNFFLDKMSDTEQERLEKLFAKAVYSSAK